MSYKKLCDHTTRVAFIDSTMIREACVNDWLVKNQEYRLVIHVNTLYKVENTLDCVYLLYRNFKDRIVLEKCEDYSETEYIERSILNLAYGLKIAVLTSNPDLLKSINAFNEIQSCDIYKVETLQPTRRI